MSTDSGWAIRRNDSCLLTKEVDCGATAHGYRACCPSSSNCPSQYNIACCPPDTNCTTAIAETPLCANSSWIMYDNAGYFCCEKGQVGYNLGNTDGCTMSGEPLPDGAVPVAVVDQTSSSTSTLVLVTTTATSTTNTTSNSPTSSPHTNKTVPGGTIAGGVVGGLAGIAVIAGLFWFFLRKRKGSTASGISQPRQEGHDGRNQYTGYSATPTLSRAEMDGTTPAAELSTTINSTKGRGEMP